MELLEFPEQNIVFANDPPQYRPLPAYRYPGDAEGRIVCCWGLTWRERLRLFVSGRIWHEILTFGHSLQPQLLAVDKPRMGPPLPDPTPSLLRTPAVSRRRVKP